MEFEAAKKLGQELSEEYHAGQTRRDGSPYAKHPARVAYTFSQMFPHSAEGVIAAFLHDVIEDVQGVSQTHLLLRGVPLESVRIVSVLTHRPGETYEEYIIRICETGGMIALAIKACDIRDNLSDSPTERQKAKLEKALCIIGIYLKALTDHLYFTASSFFTEEFR